MSLLDKLIVDLRILSKIQENGKLCTSTHGQVVIEGKSLMTPVWRTLLGDSREKAVAFLVQRIHDVAEISDNLINSPFMIEFDSSNMFQVRERNKKISELANLSRQLQNAKKGIVNFQATYKDDATASSRIEEVIDKMDRQVNEIETCLLHLKAQEKTKGHHTIY